MLASAGKNCAGHQSDRPTGDKTCLVHGPEHSTIDCKLPKEYSKKCDTQQPQNDKEYHSEGKKSGKTVNFDVKTKEVNNMVSHGEPITIKNKEKTIRKIFE